MRKLRDKARKLLTPSRKASPSPTVRATASQIPAAASDGDPSLPPNEVLPPRDEVPLPPIDVPPPPEKVTRIQVEVFDQAYDEVKQDEPGVVEAYEKILSGQLSSDVAATDVEGDPDNVIGKTAAMRKDQMNRLVDEGRVRTEKVAAIKENINKVVKPFNHLRSVISWAVRSEPAASAAWVGITTLLDVLVSPLSESGANREGIKYILERAEWYWNLSALVLDPDKVDESLTALQKSLEKSIVKLYKKLLLYQMQSVCLYSRSEAAVVMRDLVKLDDWKAQITSIEKAAEHVRKTVGQFRDEDMSARFCNIDKCLQDVRTDLQALTTAVQDLGLEQSKRHEEDKDKEFLNNLYDIDPKLEKSAIVDLKGGLVKEAHDLVLEKSNFEKLRADANGGLIWITAGPGRGKTMFLCGVIDRLLREKEFRVITYFFCRADRQKARTAKSVLRGLLWLICDQSWGIARRLREEYENQSRKMFDDDDAMVCVALEKMLAKVLDEPSTRRVIIVVDAIDECDNDSIRILIKAIGRLSNDYPAQWIVSSRNVSNYHSLLASTAPDITPSYMELSEDIVSAAVQAFVKHKVEALAKSNGYDEDIRKYLHTTLSSKACNTFLWAALVCIELDGLGIKPRHVVKTLDVMPKGLNGLYQRMLDGAFASADGPLCRQILPLVCVVARPLTLDELRALVPALQTLNDTDLREVVANCGSFLAVQGDDRGGVLSFIHQSAREYLTNTAQDNVFPRGILDHHRLVFRQALNNVKELKRNIYELSSPGVTIAEIERPEPDPLSHIPYSCLHWPDHADQLQEKGSWQMSDGEAIHAFLCSDLLHWLEAMSLLGSMRQGTIALQQLSKFYRQRPESHEVGKLVEDARRFILYNKVGIEMAPLQVYVAVTATSSQLTQELTCKKMVKCMAFSLDGRWLATGCFKPIAGRPGEHVVEIWDVLASHRIQSFRVDDPVIQVQFSPEGHKVVVVLSSGKVQHLEADSGRCVRSLFCDAKVSNAVFSRECQFVALILPDETVTILRAATAEPIQAIADVLSLCFSPDSLHLVARLTQARVAVWRVGRDTPIWTVTAHASYVAFFGNDQVAVRCDDDTIAIRAASDGSLIRTFPCHPQVNTMTWLGAGLSFLSLTHDRTIKVCNDTGTSCIHAVPTLERIMDRAERYAQQEGAQYAFCASSHFVAWVRGISVIRLWDLTMRTSPDAIDDFFLKTRYNLVSEIAFSPNTGNAPLLASLSGDSVKIWSVQGGEVICAHTFPMQHHVDLAFSPDGRHLVGHQRNGCAYVWATADGVSSVTQFSGLRKAPSFSPDGRRLALALGKQGVCLWDFAAQCVTDTISQPADQVVFSPDGHTLAIVHYSYELHRVHIEVWAASPLRRLHTFNFDKEIPKGDFEYGFISIAFSPSSKSLIVATNAAIYIWPLEAAKPRCRLAWEFGYLVEPKCLAMSPDGRLLAVAINHEVWIWHREQTTAAPLRVDIPHTTKTCRFDADSTRLWVDGGVVDLPAVTGVSGGAAIDGSVSDSCSIGDTYTGHDNVSAECWAERQGGVAFQGYKLSRDSIWVMRDSQRLLYLPPEYRSRNYETSFIKERIAFMGSTVAIGSVNGLVYLLRFQDDMSAGDLRWAY
ncbi:hypothetical protein EDB80DRAFT_887869 [Ilyonectria destructans]|nr:hypothetical protein EDB80DRAFT_887869 [Ilyonectria destructans]